MACAAVAISNTPVATTTDLLQEYNGLHRSHSSKDLYKQTGLKRSRSFPKIRHSLNRIVQAVSTEPNLKSSRSVGIFPFQFSASILQNSLRSFLFESESEAEEEENEREDEGEDETGKRANWVERLMELRRHWRNRQREGETEIDDYYCSVEYDSEVEEEKEETVLDSESFSRFLVRVPLSEMKLFSKLAFLCNMAYVIPELKAEDLESDYNLHFVTSSLEKKAGAAAIKAKQKLDHDSSPVTETPPKSISGNSLESEQKRSIRPHAAYGIAASAASYVHSHAKGLLSLARQHSSSQAEEKKRGDDAEREEACGAREEEGGGPPSRIYKSEVAAYVAATTMTAVVAAEEKDKLEAAKDLRSLHSSPCEWFICDDPTTYTRCFVIQGSDSLASWQANLFFEPTKFEGTEVQVHRGIYEAAKGIYDQFMPEVLKHLNLYGERARLQFTGHSLGGSLSLLVHLMLLKRGVVKPSTLMPIVTFGSPFVFCGGHRILDDMGLDEDLVYSVIMHRDIVPRAFSCDYPNHAVQLLKRVNSALRSHPCLNSNKLLYSPMGQLFILQPDQQSSPPHPFLPPGSGLYALDITQGGSQAEVARALRAFLNSPHPLETLSDPTAYGSEGTILRDHDSSNYSKAIHGILRQHTKWVGRRSRRKRSHLWWPLLTMSPQAWNREGTQENSGLVAKEVTT